MAVLKQLLLLLAATAALASRGSAPQRIPQPTRRTSASSSNSSRPLEVIQAATPPRRSFDGYSCKQTLLEHDFANSYGAPYVGFYSPPPADCAFTTTVFNLSVSSRGQQYDRLALLFLGDVEVWRTSTAMPTDVGAGIHWSFQKDMSIFDALLRGETAEQKIILDLGNVVDGDLYTGTFNVTLEALYYDDAYDATTGGFHPADHIYPLSNLSSAANKSSVFSLPDDDGTVTLALPRTARTAVVSLLASGNGAEEFWYTNVPSEWLDTFGGDDSLYGYGPFREVQLLVDGRLAGASWPFPVLFTGGVDPGLWRPVVGIDAYDLPSFEIDVTPWLPLLCDGEAHTLGVRVVGFDAAGGDGGLGAVGQNWWVTGAVFVWLDEDVDQTAAAGAVISTDVSAPVFDYVPQLTTSVAANGSAVNESLWVSLSARRTLSVSSHVSTANNGTRAVSWTQELSFSSVLNTSNAAWDASLVMQSAGSYSGSFSGGQTSRYSYPLNLYYSYYIADTDAELSSVSAAIDRSLLASGVPALPYLTGTSLGAGDLATKQNVTSRYYWNETIVAGLEDLDSSDGETWYSSSGVPGGEFGVAAYSRYLVEKDDAVTVDKEAWATIDVPVTEPLPDYQ